MPADRIPTSAALALLLGVTACAHRDVFDPPPGGTETQFHRDNLECAMMAKAIVGDGFVYGPPLYVAIALAQHRQAGREASRECLLGKGYTLHAEQ